MTTLPSINETTQVAAGAYRDGAPTYRTLGWDGVLPCDWPGVGRPPEGYTGGVHTLNWGVYPTDQQVQTWRDTRATASLGLRVPDDVLVVDVDCYDGKRGCETLAWWEEQVGSAIPPTWYSTSRQDGSRKLFYRVPRYGRGAWREPGTGLELLHHGHRWVRVWPSRSPKTGAEERWFDPSGLLSERPPGPGQLTELPPEWVASFRRTDDVSQRRGVRVAVVDERESFDWSRFADDVEPGAQNQLLHDALSSLRGGSRRGLRFVGQLLAQRFVNDPASPKGPWTPEVVDQVVESVLRYPNGPSETALTPDQVRWAEQLARGDVELLEGWLDVTELDRLTPPSYLVKELLDRPAVALLHGDGGTGKSFLALDVALHVALGREWRGRRVLSTRVAYVYTEGPAYAPRRLNAWSLHHATPLDALRGRLAVYPRPLNLLGPPEPLEALVGWVQRWGAGLVVFDTYRRNTVGGNENATQDVSRALAWASRLAEVNATTLVVHHDNKAGGYAGSTTLHGHVDTRLHLTRHEHDLDVVVLETDKQREAAASGDVYSRLEQVVLGSDTDGDPITSAVIVECDEPSDSRVGAFADELRLDREVLRLVELVQGRPGCTTRHLRERLGVRAERVAYVVEEAENRGLIHREDGPKRAQLHYLT